MKYFTYTIILAVAVAIVAGFFVVGSPQEERLRRFDQQRVSDLQFLQREIVNYWQSKERLPNALAHLQDDIRGITIPKDPETGAPYGYEIIGDLSFNLCATFNKPSFAPDQVLRHSKLEAPPYGGVLSQNWEHAAGEVCFERTIDKDFYPVRKPGERR